MELLQAARAQQNGRIYQELLAVTVPQPFVPRCDRHAPLFARGFLRGQGCPLGSFRPQIELLPRKSPATLYAEGTGNRLRSGHSIDCPRRDA
jgi:hypothetical protein